MATRPPASAVSTTATAITAKESEALLKFRQLAESNLKVIHKNQERYRADQEEKSRSTRRKTPVTRADDAVGSSAGSSLLIGSSTATVVPRKPKSSGVTGGLFNSLKRVITGAPPLHTGRPTTSASTSNGTGGPPRRLSGVSVHSSRSVSSREDDSSLLEEKPRSHARGAPSTASAFPTTTEDGGSYGTFVSLFPQRSTSSGGGAGGRPRRESNEGNGSISSLASSEDVTPGLSSSGGGSSGGRVFAVPEGDSPDAKRSRVRGNNRGGQLFTFPTDVTTADLSVSNPELMISPPDVRKVAMFQSRKEEKRGRGSPLETSPPTRIDAASRNTTGGGSGGGGGESARRSHAGRLPTTRRTQRSRTPPLDDRADVLQDSDASSDSGNGSSDDNDGDDGDGGSVVVKSDDSSGEERGGRAVHFTYADMSRSAGAGREDGGGVQARARGHHKGLTYPNTAVSSSSNRVNNSRPSGVAPPPQGGRVSIHSGGPPLLSTVEEADRESLQDEEEDATLSPTSHSHRQGHGGGGHGGRGHGHERREERSSPHSSSSSRRHTGGGTTAAAAPQSQAHRASARESSGEGGSRRHAQAAPLAHISSSRRDGVSGIDATGSEDGHSTGSSLLSPTSTLQHAGSSSSLVSSRSSRHAGGGSGGGGGGNGGSFRLESGEGGVEELLGMDREAGSRKPPGRTRSGSDREGLSRSLERGNSARSSLQKQGAPEFDVRDFLPAQRRLYDEIQAQAGEVASLMEAIHATETNINRRVDALVGRTGDLFVALPELSRQLDAWAESYDQDCAHRRDEEIRQQEVRLRNTIMRKSDRKADEVRSKLNSLASKLRDLENDSLRELLAKIGSSMLGYTWNGMIVLVGFLAVFLGPIIAFCARGWRVVRSCCPSSGSDAARVATPTMLPLRQVNAVSKMQLAEGQRSSSGGDMSVATSGSRQWSEPHSEAGSGRSDGGGGSLPVAVGAGEGRPRRHHDSGRQVARLTMVPPSERGPGGDAGGASIGSGGNSNATPVDWGSRTDFSPLERLPGLAGVNGSFRSDGTVMRGAGSPEATAASGADGSRWRSAGANTGSSGGEGGGGGGRLSSPKSAPQQHREAAHMSEEREVASGSAAMMNNRMRNKVSPPGKARDKESSSTR